MTVKFLHILAIICLGLAFFLYLAAIPFEIVALVVCAIVLEIVAWGLILAGGFGKDK